MDGKVTFRGGGTKNLSPQPSREMVSLGVKFREISNYILLDQPTSTSSPLTARGCEACWKKSTTTKAAAASCRIYLDP